MSKVWKFAVIIGLLLFVLASMATAASAQEAISMDPANCAEIENSTEVTDIGTVENGSVQDTAGKHYPNCGEYADPIGDNIVEINFLASVVTAIVGVDLDHGICDPRDDPNGPCENQGWLVTLLYQGAIVWQNILNTPDNKIGIIELGEGVVADTLTGNGLGDSGGINAVIATITPTPPTQTATPTDWTETPTSTTTDQPTETPTDVNNTPTATPTDTPTDAGTNTPSATSTETPTEDSTSTPTDTGTDTPTSTTTDQPNETPTDVLTNTPTETPTDTPTTTSTETPATQTNTPTPVILTGTPDGSPTPTDQPSETPTDVLTNTPTSTPTDSAATPPGTVSGTPTVTPTGNNIPTETPNGTNTPVGTETPVETETTPESTETPTSVPPTTNAQPTDAPPAATPTETPTHYNIDGNPPYLGCYFEPGDWVVDAGWLGQKIWGAPNGDINNQSIVGEVKRDQWGHIIVQLNEGLVGLYYLNVGGLWDGITTPHFIVNIHWDDEAGRYICDNEKDKNPESSGAALTATNLPIDCDAEYGCPEARCELLPQPNDKDQAGMKYPYWSPSLDREVDSIVTMNVPFVVVYPNGLIVRPDVFFHLGNTYNIVRRAVSGYRGVYDLEGNEIVFVDAEGADFRLYGTACSACEDDRWDQNGNDWLYFGENHTISGTAAMLAAKWNMIYEDAFTIAVEASRAYARAVEENHSLVGKEFLLTELYETAQANTEK